MDKIIEYIKGKYSPKVIIVYGSYADGTNNINSDFDALVISENSAKLHDTSFVEGIQLDVFVYPEDYFSGGFEREDFVRIFDGKVVADTDDIGKRLIDSVKNYISSRQAKTEDEIKAGIAWCRKMLLRTQRGDVEGMFRWHWVLTDSLEIFYDAKHIPYFGPKKSLRQMEQNFPEAFEIYSRALSDFSQDSLNDWIAFLETI